MATIQEALSEVQAAESAWGRRDIEATRVRLDSFWRAKAAAWTSDKATQAALTLMDADAHSVWARMEDHLALQADTNSAERAAHAKASAEAWAKSARLREEGGASQRYIASAQRQAQAALSLNQTYNRIVPDDRYSTAVQSQIGNILGGDILGIPTWAWIAGGGLVVVLLVAGRR